jgi:hypothetical protein
MPTAHRSELKNQVIKILKSTDNICEMDMLILPDRSNFMIVLFFVSFA